MSPEIERQTLQTLRDIHESQREIVCLLTAHRSLYEEQMRRSRESIAESVSLQKLGLRRQRAVTLIAFTGIAACLALIAYLVVRYF
jgi:hypothetical protein